MTVNYWMIVMISTCITLVSHVGGFHDHTICQLYYVGSFTIHTFRPNLEIWAELYFRHLAHALLFIPGKFTRYTIHPNIIP